VVLVALLQLPGISLSFPSTLVYADSAASVVAPKRPPPSNQAPPPTLAPAPTATATAVPTSAPTPTAVASPTAQASRTYTVQHGDELKYIAAQYGVSIWSIIDTNDIPDPDSLRVGQVLKIPDH
jgi:LysM repeat protein